MSYHKTCSDCGADYPVIRPTGAKSGKCVPCAKKRVKVRMDPYQAAKHAGPNSWYRKNWQHVQDQNKTWRKDNRCRVLWAKARGRALRKGIPFNLEVSDVIIPSHCPVFNMPFDMSATRQNNDSPTLDRIVPELGYVKGNIRIISWRANRLKSDSTPQEIEALYVDSCNLLQRKVG